MIRIRLSGKLLFIIGFVSLSFFLIAHINLPSSTPDYVHANNDLEKYPTTQETISNKTDKKLEKSQGNNNSSEKEDTIVVLVLACNRPTVKRCLDSLFKYRPANGKFPIVVSQDCGGHEETFQTINAYSDKITYITQPDLSEISVPPWAVNFGGYYKISRHYRFALNHVFEELKAENVIIVEDDLEIAPDFFEYFTATLPLLRKDPTLWCVSAWNDNGKEKRINMTAPELLHRTDFFPGLGWMLTKKLWKELKPKWPKGFWDDWMREPKQRKARICLRPEISRTSTFGKRGVSLGTYFDNHLRFIKLNDKFVPFTWLDLSYLNRDQYNKNLIQSIKSSEPVKSIQDLKSVIQNSNDSATQYVLMYQNNKDFAIMAKQLDIMDDLKAGVPRTGYLGIVTFIYSGRRVYLTPADMTRLHE